jgi:hypothetical protein
MDTDYDSYEPGIEGTDGDSDSQALQDLSESLWLQLHGKKGLQETDKEIDRLLDASTLEPQEKAVAKHMARALLKGDTSEIGKAIDELDKLRKCDPESAARIEKQIIADMRKAGLKVKIEEQGISIMNVKGGCLFSVTVDGQVSRSTGFYSRTGPDSYVYRPLLGREYGPGVPRLEPEEFGPSLTGKMHEVIADGLNGLLEEIQPALWAAEDKQWLKDELKEAAERLKKSSKERELRQHLKR